MQGFSVFYRNEATFLNSVRVTVNSVCVCDGWWSYFLHLSHCEKTSMTLLRYTEGEIIASRNKPFNINMVNGTYFIDSLVK